MKRTKAIIITIVLIMAETLINQGFQNPPGGGGKSLIAAAISESEKEREDSEMAKTFDRQIVNGETYLIKDSAAREAVNDEVADREEAVAAEATAREAAVDALSADLSDYKNALNQNIYLDKSSFQIGAYNVDGTFITSGSSFRDWAGHRKYLHVGNAQGLLFKHRSTNPIKLNLYGFGKNKETIGLQQITVDAEKQIIIPIASGVYFYAVSLCTLDTSNIDLDAVDPIVGLIEYDCTATAAESVLPDIPDFSFSDYCTVGTKDEDYDDIGTAYNGMERQGVLFVSPMLIDAGNQGFQVGSLYMKARESRLTVLEAQDIVYPYAAVGIAGECMVEGVVFRSRHSSTSANGAYAMHVENNSTQGKTLYFKDCVFDSEWQSGIGVGLRKDSHFVFENCVFINQRDIEDAISITNPYDYTVSGAAFFHGSIDSGNKGTQHITFINCKFISKGAGALRMEDVAGNLVVATFIGCTFESKMYGIMNAVDIVGGAEPGYLCGSSIKLGKMSHGNNIECLNADRKALSIY